MGFEKKSYNFFLFLSLSVQNFAVVWPTITELSSEEKVCLQSCRAEYSGNWHSVNSMCRSGSDHGDGNPGEQSFEV